MLFRRNKMQLCIILQRNCKILKIKWQKNAHNLKVARSNRVPATN